MFRFGKQASQLASRFSAAASLRSFSARRNVPLAKIVATIGPASENLPMLPAVVEAGMRIMRINFSHATYDEADLRVKNLVQHSTGINCIGGKNHTLGKGEVINASRPADGNFNLRSILLDTQGPEVRTGKFVGGNVDYSTGDKVELTMKKSDRELQTKDLIWISYEPLINAVDVGQSILLDDGALEAIVTGKDSTTGRIQCVMNNGGTLGNRKGVNIPGAVLSELPPMSDKDKDDIQWGMLNDIDYIAASFVRRPKDVLDIQAYCRELIAAGKCKPGMTVPLIISKIESIEAMDNFDDILAVSDAIMVARGDLGVEIPMEVLALAQKDIVNKCVLAGKPVIVATQMLESMQKNPRPTRAECTDVANAIFDGADCVMLSGESAKGKYPIGAVTTMNKIVMSTEKYEKDNHGIKKKLSSRKPVELNKHDAVATGIVEASNNLNVSCIVCISKTGKMATKIASQRPHVPIVTFVPSIKAGRLLQIYRGIHPVVAPFDLLQMKEGSRFAAVTNYTKKLGFAESGDTVIIVAAEGEQDGLGTSVTMRVVDLK
jgi:pyruvate kinase